MDNDDNAAVWTMVGACVRMGRILRDLTLKDLADQADVEVTRLSRFETGDRGLPPAELARIARVLDLRVDNLPRPVSVLQSGRLCEWCGEPMECLRSTRRFCAKRCQVAAYRERQSSTP